MQHFVLPDCFYLIPGSCFDHENSDLSQLFTRNLDGGANSSVGILLLPASETQSQTSTLLNPLLWIYVGYGQVWIHILVQTSFFLNSKIFDWRSQEC